MRNDRYALGCVLIGAAIALGSCNAADPAKGGALGEASASAQLREWGADLVEVYFYPPTGSMDRTKVDRMSDAAGAVPMMNGLTEALGEDRLGEGADRINFYFSYHPIWDRENHVKEAEWRARWARVAVLSEEATSP